MYIELNIECIVHGVELILLIVCTSTSSLSLGILLSMCKLAFDYIYNTSISQTEKDIIINTKSYV